MSPSIEAIERCVRVRVCVCVCSSVHVCIMHTALCLLLYNAVYIYLSEMYSWSELQHLALPAFEYSKDTDLIPGTQKVEKPHILHYGILVNDDSTHQVHIVITHTHHISLGLVVWYPWLPVVTLCVHACVCW